VATRLPSRAAGGGGTATWFRDLVRPLPRSANARRLGTPGVTRASVHQPDFLIIGAQRGASTWLNAAMRAHPQIFTSRFEVQFFEDPYYDGDASLLDEFAAEAGHRIWGFKRPELLARPECPPRMAEHAPDAKLLAMLREPIARTVSCYYLFVKTLYLPHLPLNEGLRNLLAGKYSDEYPWGDEVLTASDYATSLHRHLEYYERRKLFVRLDVDLKDDAGAVLRDAYDFVGVDPHVKPVVLDRRSNAGVFNATRMSFHRAAARAMYYRDTESNHMLARMNPLSVAVVRAAHLTDRSVLQRMLPDRPEKLEPDVKSALVERFRSEIDELETLLDRPLDRWRQSQLDL
jgi:hypothetical protein